MRETVGDIALIFLYCTQVIKLRLKMKTIDMVGYRRYNKNEITKKTLKVYEERDAGERKC